MQNYSLAEIYFVAAMMILITAGSFAAVFFFFRTYKREKAQNQKEMDNKLKQKKEESKQRDYVEK